MGRYTNHCNLLDLCALALPTTDAATNIPFGITLFGLAENEHLIRGVAQRFLCGISIVPTTDDLTNPTASNQTDTTAIAVCGLHMRGYPLEKQMQEFGAQFIREAITAPKYQMLKLPTTPAKPGLVRRQSGGAAIELEIWSMPTAMLGAFVASIPSPLCIGKIELQDEEEVSGFLCEAIAAEEAEDITRYGGWRKLPV
jgi:allophanate hydrolase